MEILVFGAGAMGSFFGGMLSVRHDVWLVGREEHIAAVRDHGLRISGKTLRLARPHAVTRIPRTSNPELVLVSTKAYDTRSAMKALARFRDSALFLTLQNGLDNADTIGETARRVIAGTTSHGVTYIRPGEVRHAGVGETTIGPWRGVTNADVVRIRDVLEDSGIRVRISRDIRSELWAKLVVNAAINPLAALAGVPNGRLAQDPDLSQLLEAVARETTAVARSDGADLGEEEMVRRTRLVVRRTAANRASMLQDLDRGRPTEVDAITGAVLRAAERASMDAPLNRALLALVRSRERARVSQD